MKIEELSKLIKENGIVGAGGAGFPTYVKIDKRANTILLNCAECEPLLKLHRQLLQKYAKEIIKTLALVADMVEASEVIICVKEEYKSTIEALQAFIGEYKNVKLHTLKGVYPMGDEVVMIYEATGKVIPPGGLPIEAGISVFNVETMYNIYRALEKKAPVTEKLVTIVGEVKNPLTITVPLGLPLSEVVALAGGTRKTEELKSEEVVYLVGGPMMGRIGSPYDTVTKTTNAILVLPKSHILIQNKLQDPSISMKRAASACCQCRCCTDLCPRNNLGHPIEPHRFMQAASNHKFDDLDAFMNLFFCSGCGLCESYSCPQGLAPRTLIDQCKNGMRSQGVKAPKVEAAPVKVQREYRKAPENRLEARLGLTKYETEAPLVDREIPLKTLRIYLSQHIGAPAKTVVKKGDMIQKGQMIGAPAEGVSVPIHASVTGKVTDVTEKYIEVKCD